MISFIVANKNRRDLVDACIQSYQSLNVSRELIVVDGGSTDGSREYLSDFADILIAEPDKSVYDAWNKGIAKASGEWIFFLNTDDEVQSDGFSQIYATLQSVNTSIANFNVVINQLGSKNNLRKRRSKYKFDEIISSPIYFNSYIFNREIFSTVGKFSEDFQICADQDFLWRCLDNALKTTFIDVVGYRYSTHKDSLTLSHSKKFFREELEIAHKNLITSQSDIGKKYSKLWIEWEEVSVKYENAIIARCMKRLFHRKLFKLQLRNIFK
jgi:glycosyltransferase involved in cell wall biosynthesis